MSSDESFESTEEGTLFAPGCAGDIKKNHYMLMKANEYPCKIVSVSHCKTGKHGSAKCSITGIDLFTGKKHEDSLPSSAQVKCPIVTKTEYSLINILEDNFLSIMDEESGDVREDIQLDSLPYWAEVNEKIIADFEAGHELLVTVLKSMNREVVISHRKTS